MGGYGVAALEGAVRTLGAAAVVGGVVHGDGEGQRGEEEEEDEERT